jgi:hypothetical protein
MGLFKRLRGDAVVPPPVKLAEPAPAETVEQELEPELNTGPEYGALLPETWPSAATLHFGRSPEVVGVEYHRGAIEAALDAEYKLDKFAVLAPEPEKQFDETSVAVFVDGRKVGSLSKTDAFELRPQIDRAMSATGFAVTTISLYRGYENWICLEPESAEPVSKAAAVQVLVDAGYRIGASFREGFDVKIEDKRLIVIWNKVAKVKQSEQVTAMAKTFRALGYSARVVSTTSRPYVSLTDFSSPAE